MLTDEVAEEPLPPAEEPEPTPQPEPVMEEEMELAEPEPPSPPPSPLLPELAPSVAEPTEHIAGPGVGEVPLVSPDVAEASA